jgi:tripartite-type tricarboxylate transporter receptor subunit TctC
MKLKTLVMAGVLAAVSALPGMAQDLKLSRINATVPFGEGGGSDTLMRAVAPYLSKAMPGQPTILIQNTPGGGGIPGTNRFVASAEPDGSALLALSSSLFIATVLEAPQIKFTLDQFVPVFIAPMAPIYYVSPSTGATGVGDVEGIKNAKLVFGGGRQDSADVLTVMQFDLLGISIQSVWGLERGASRIGFERGEFNVDHQTTAAFNNSVKPLVDEGKAIPFMASGIIDPSGKIVRDPNFPDMPTFMELYEKVHGKPLTGAAYDAYYALMSAAITTGKAIVLPATAPANVVDAYAKAFTAVMADPEFKAANAAALGGYTLYTGAEAQALWGTVNTLEDAAFAWLADWYQTRIGFTLKR